MKITVEISDSDLKEIQRITNEKRKGPAIRKLAREALNLMKRRTLGQKIVRGEWSVDLPAIEKLRQDRRLR
jgi:hypothetical protein